MWRANFDSLLEFTNRQILITKVYAQETWTMGFVTHALYCVTLLLGTILTLGNLIATVPAFHLATLTFLPVLLGIIRSSLRLAGVTEVLPAVRSQIMGLAWIYLLSDDRDSVSLSGELRDVAGNAKNPLARHDLRTDFARANAHPRILT